METCTGVNFLYCLAEMAEVLGDNIWELLQADPTLCQEVRRLLISLPTFIKKEAIAQAGVRQAEALRATIALEEEGQSVNASEM